MLEISIQSMQEEYRAFEDEGYAAFSIGTEMVCPYNGVALFYWIHGWCKAEIDAGINFKAKERM